MPRNLDDAPARQTAWASYWRSGALHSCATSFQGNYGGAIAAFWRDAFDGLQPGDHVLDLAAGNGALSQLLIEHRADADIGCDAVDLAPIAPAWVAALPPSQSARLRFHGNTPAEALPFEAGRFALVVSQYGLEYTDLDASAAELLRVLRRPGRVALLVHHAASRPVGLAHDEIGHVDWLLAPDGLLDAGAAMLPLLARASTAEGRAGLAQDAQALARRRRFNELQQQLARRADGAPCPDVLYETREAVAALLDIAARRGADQAQARLPALREALTLSRVRLTDLCRCALDEAAVAALAQRFAALGAARIEPLHEAGWLMGWALRIG